MILLASQTNFRLLEPGVCCQLFEWALWLLTEYSSWWTRRQCGTNTSAAPSATFWQWQRTFQLGFGFSLLDCEKVIAQKNHQGEDSRCKWTRQAQLCSQLILRLERIGSKPLQQWDDIKKQEKKKLLPLISMKSNFIALIFWLPWTRYFCDFIIIIWLFWIFFEFSLNLFIIEFLFPFFLFSQNKHSNNAQQGHSFIPAALLLLSDRLQEELWFTLGDRQLQLWLCSPRSEVFFEGLLVSGNPALLFLSGKLNISRKKEEEEEKGKEEEEEEKERRRRKEERKKGEREKEKEMSQ